LSNQPEAGETHIIVRRRRTRRHRRNRQIRRVLFAVFGAGLAIGFAVVALQQRYSDAAKAAERNRQAAVAGQAVLLLTQQESLRHTENRPVYPYSIIPGGVKDAQELKWAADHDPVVAAHYAGFDYGHAHLEVLKATLNAYISYRIGKKVYWVRHPVRLRKGETLITDGKIRARTRCANRVEEVPQQATSQSEPPAAKFDEPIQPTSGTAMTSPPVPFESSLMNRPPVPGLGPASPLSLYDPFTNGGGTPVFPPPLSQVCGIGPKKPGSGGTTGGISVVTGKGKKKPVNPCASGGGGSGGEVPEPGTWLLVASGLAAVYWKARHRFART